MEDRNDHIDSLNVYRCWHVFLYFACCYCLLSFLVAFIFTGFYVSSLDGLLSQPAPDYLIFLFVKGLIVSSLQGVMACLSLYFAFKFSDRA